jgi:SAM-dependent methyltransferase
MKTYHDKDGKFIPSVMYPDFLEQTLNEYVPNKTVLAIGSSSGIEADIVEELNPETLFTVDPHVEYDIGGDIIPDFYGTANDYYKQENLPNFDVVLCMGLLYHLHSPFHLLEQIVNISKPKILIVESLMKEASGPSLEVDWAEPGNAHSDVGIEYPLMVHSGPSPTGTIRALETTPMKLHKFYEYSRKTEDYSEMVPLYYEDEEGNGDRHSDIGTRKNGMWLGVFKL